MRVEVDQSGNIVIKEVYNSLILETAEGLRVAICMRDSGFEFRIIPKEGDPSPWYSALPDGTLAEGGR